MPLVAAIAGSPSSPSRSVALIHHVAAELARRGLETETLSVRDLDPTDLLQARVDSPTLSAALRLIERADGIVVATPVYKASYTGVLKAFLDLLPQFGLAGKVVLPLATGGTLAHVLAIDYALRPVLTSLGARHVVNGLFLLDKAIPFAADGRALSIDPDLGARLDGVIADFATSLTLHRSIAQAA